MQNLRTAQMDLHKIDEQASEIVALKEQMAAKEFGWDQEKQKILKALKSERALKKELREELKATKDVLGKEKDEIIRSLLEKQHESAKFGENYEKKAKHVTFKMDFEAKLKTQQEDLEKVRQTVLDLESYAAQKDSELIRSEAEWKIKLTAQEDQMRSKPATKEESFQRDMELQRQSRAMAVEWRKLKEEIKLLTQQNADLQVHNLSLQELAQQTGEEKAQFEKEEKKVRQTVLDLESYAAQKDSELIHSEAEWKIKLTALEDQMRSELAAKEESFQNELQRQSREMEEWRNQKEELKLLTQQNADLQVHNLHLQELAQQNGEDLTSAAIYILHLESVNQRLFEQEEKKVRQTVLDLESYVAQKDSELIHSEAEWKIKLTAQEDQMRSELAAKEESCQNELQRQSREMEEWRNQKEEINFLTQQNADLQVHNLCLQELAQQTEEEKAQFEQEEKEVRQTVLDLESYAAEKDSELIHSEAEWKIKLTAQEDQMRSELAAKEESFQREKELQRQSRELEEWRCNQKEELKLLTQQNTDLHVHNLHLQELAQLTDKEKAQFKKEEKKARKEAEKTLKKDMKEAEKTLKKDRKEAEKTLKKDRKEEEKREKKEKKENEKREKEELKTQKKERKENEKRQKKEELENKEKGRK